MAIKISIAGAEHVFSWVVFIFYVYYNVSDQSVINMHF